MANELRQLLDEIRDPRLRDRLSAAVGELRKTKKFGLVFEEHLPELLPIYSAKIRSHAHVARKDGKLTETFIVERVSRGIATVKAEHGEGEPQNIPVAQLVVVKRFGEAIFPALRHVESVLRGGDTPHHTLIEADNYHALQLLEWLYLGKVDCIYIDPPYNTGARDWKYNNNYVDANDGWRHSKWLAMMRRRLRLAKRLLKPQSGVLIVTIDEHEVNHLGLLLEEEFPDAYRQLVTIVITARGVAKQGLARVEEYAYYIYLGTASACPTEDDFLSDEGALKKKNPWASLLRRGTNAAPIDRAGLVYPIFLNPATGEITGVGETLAERVKRGELKMNELNAWSPIRTKSEAWPIRSDGQLGTWQVKPATLLQLKEKGFARIGRFDDKRTSWSVNYLKKGPIGEIEKGELLVTGYEWDGGPAVLEYAVETITRKRAKTVWHRTSHDAGTYGSSLLRTMLGRRAFEFPKSLYSTRDALSTVVANNPSALIVDFFAGSGTTLNAVNLLNASDGGTRQCILVTNNDLSGEETDAMTAQGIRPGSPAWEQHGICQSITFPRCKFAINGKRDDGTELSGEYLTGRYEDQVMRRSIRPLDFATVETLANKKAREALALAVNFAKSKVTGEESFLLAEGESVAVLLDPAALDAFIEQGEEWAEGIETVYLPFSSGRTFNQARDQIVDTWPPLTKAVEATRPMKDGFVANLDYFRLDFLDRSQAEIGGKLADVLPSLWMMAGCRGKLPIAKRDEKMFFFKDCPFAVLVEESAVKLFLAKLSERPDIDWVFVVSHDQDSFARICEWLPEHIPAAQRVHLWRNYVDNFLINVDRGTGGVQ